MIFSPSIPSVMKKPKQLILVKTNADLRHGGELRKKANGRGHRPLSSKESMHLVLRSSLAKGLWSFRHPKNFSKVTRFITNFSDKKGIRIIRAANVGNHLHFQIRIPNRTLYKAWIRGLTSGLAMLVAGRDELKALGRGFWDYRPFTRVIRGLRALLNLRDYIYINQYESTGSPRAVAVYLVKGTYNWGDG